MASYNDCVKKVDDMIIALKLVDDVFNRLIL